MKRQNLEKTEMQIMVVMVVLTSLISGVRASDTTALSGFFKGLNSTTNVNNACSFEGVKCKDNRVQELKLANRSLSGTILPGTLGNLSELHVLHLEFNHLTGPIPLDIFTNCTQLRELHLQSNYFDGSIPASLNTQKLKIIDLSNNTLTGNIPDIFNISNTPKITTINLSKNNFSGSIPASLASLNLTIPELLNLSYNNLSGEIPAGLRSLNRSWFEGNPELCGLPLTKSCNSSSPGPSSPKLSNSSSPGPSSPKLSNSSSSKLSKLQIGLIIAASVFALAILLCICALLWRITKTKKMVITKTDNGEMLEQEGMHLVNEEVEPSSTATALVVLKQKGRSRLDIDELMRGSAEMLGHGKFGSAFKTVLDDESAVVVKKVKRGIALDRREFESHLESISHVEHPLVAPLIGYYWTKEEKLLLSEYFPLGSLYDALHGPNKKPLVWDQRIKVAIDVALALKEIHAISENMIHGDIRSSKIFFKEEGCVVSNMGLVAIIDKKVFIKVNASYLAPEVLQAQHLTQKSDVYSFGVLLMELLTRKTPSNVKEEQDIELAQWVQCVTNVEWTTTIFDKELQDEATDYGIQQELISLM